MKELVFGNLKFNINNKQMKATTMHSVGTTGRKLVETFENGITLQCVEDADYTKGKVDIHLTYNSTLKGGGGMYNQNLREELPPKTIELIEFLGGRVTKKHIVYGAVYVDPKAKLSKLADMRVIASYVSESLKKS